MSHYRRYEYEYCNTRMYMILINQGFGYVVPGTGVTRNTNIWRQLHVTAGQLHVAVQAEGASY